MAFTFAGRYGPEPCMNTNAGLLASTAVTVYESDGSTLASLYTSRTKATAADNPVTTDARGNLSFFADPGEYVLSILGSTVAVTVPVDTVEVAQDSDLANYVHPSGEWAALTAYQVNDVVTWQAAAWRCITAHTSGSTFSSGNWEQWGAPGDIDGDGRVVFYRTIRIRVDNDGGVSNPKLEFYALNAQWRLGVDNANGTPGTDFVPIVLIDENRSVQDNFYVSFQGTAGSYPTNLSSTIVRFGFGVTPPSVGYRVQTAGGTTGAYPEVGGFRSLVRTGQTGHAYVMETTTGPRWWVKSDGTMSGNLANNGGAVRIDADATNQIPLTLRKSDGTAGWQWYYSGNNLYFKYATTAVDALRVNTGGTVAVGPGAAAIATTATSGFLGIPICNGTPTGTPTSMGSHAYLVYDYANNLLYANRGGVWRSVAMA